MKIDRLLAEHQLLVTTAESCTGGLVASALVDIPGISDYFKGDISLMLPKQKKRYWEYCRRPFPIMVS